MTTTTTTNDTLVHSNTGNVVATGAVLNNGDGTFDFSANDGSNTFHCFNGRATDNPSVFVWQNWVN